jgi:CheY-like chemotaxis protein
MAKVFDTLRLNNDQIQELVDELERPLAHEIDSRRLKRRWSVDGARVILATLDDSGQTTRQLAVARNLSSSGVALITGKFVYPGTACTATFKNLGGDIRTESGTVVRCRHVQGRIHDVGVRLKSAVDPREFIEFGEANGFSTEHVDLTELKGVVLIVEDSRADQKLFSQYFNGSGLELLFSQDGEGGLMMLDDQPDLVFVGDRLRDMSGIDFILQARRGAYGGPVVLLVTGLASEQRDLASGAGANELLVKPCPPELMHQAAAEYLLTQSTRCQEAGRIETTVDLSVISAELVCGYIDSMIEECESLADAIEKKEIERVKQVLRSIHGSSGSYGFASVGVFAEQALDHVEESGSIDVSMMPLQRIIGMCQQVRRPEA